MKNTPTLQALLAPTVEAMGYEFWGVIYMPQGRHAVLRVYIDSEEGITVFDCERVSRQVSAVLDVEDPLKGVYTLEVSSPGLDRPLFTPEQFRRYIGAKVNVRFHMPIENRRHLKGVLEQVIENEVSIQDENGIEFKIAFDNIAKANVVPDDVIHKGKKVRG